MVRKKDKPRGGSSKEDEEKQSKDRRKEETATNQPPPPALEEGAGEGLPWHHDHDHDDDEHHHHKHPHHHDHDHHHHHIDHEAAELIYSQLLEVRRTVDTLVQETKEAKLRKRLEQAPVRTSDLMRGFQAAVARANRSARSGEEEEGEDIERMSIKDLEIALSAPIIDGGHAEDPVMMLPNIKSASAEAASVSLKFTVVSVPLKQRG